MIVLSADQLSKRYWIRHETEGSRAASLAQRWRRLRLRREAFWALRDVSFTVREGEALGIIGHNGAGKSTILKLLSNITTPTRGRIVIHGRLASLIEVGSGFHPELTGRENIYLNGSILGMRRREIAAKFDSIVEFAELRQFVDVPVKRYSSGMYVRLGFSIAAHLEPDILLLDEVLAVGDASFQAKCLQRIAELKQAGTTIVFISHDLGAVDQLCDRVLLMQNGAVRGDGVPARMIAEYQEIAATLVHTVPMDDLVATGTVARCTSVIFTNSDGAETTTVTTGGALRLRLTYVALAPLDDTVFTVFFHTGDNELYCLFRADLGSAGVKLSPGAGAIEFTCEELGFQPGAYNISVAIDRRSEVLEWQNRHYLLRVTGGNALLEGRCYVPHRWRVVDSLE